MSSSLPSIEPFESSSVQFDFTGHLRRVYALANVTLLDTDTVSVSELEFLRNASLLINSASPRLVQNYLIWRFIISRSADMPQYIRILRERFDRVFRGTTAEQPRTIICGNYVNNNMGFAVSKLYIKHYFDETARNQVGRIATDTRVHSLPTRSPST